MPRESQEDRRERLRAAYSHPALRTARACPFCGDRRIGVAAGPKAPIFSRDTWYVFCAGCRGRGPLGLSPEEAVAYWSGHLTPGAARPIE